jgi:hypothetical protein
VGFFGMGDGLIVVFLERVGVVVHCSVASMFRQGLSGYFASCPPAASRPPPLLTQNNRTAPAFVFAVRHKMTGQPQPLFVALRRSKGQGVSAVAK